MQMENGGIAAVADEPGSAASSMTDDRPIMCLFKKLIGNDNKKKKMLLTDAQIKEMLKIEFDIDTDYLYDIEIDIYLAVTKKYLKSWPQWNHFNNLVNGLLNAQAYPALNKVYLKKYAQFKEYLGKKLETTKRLAAETVENVTPEKNEQTESADLFLEVVCSRSHLNQLVYQVPNSHENHIFRSVESVPTQISILKEHTLESILNWWCVSVNFNLSIFSYKREITHELEHMLINKVRTENSVKNIVLDQDLMTRTSNKRLDHCDKAKINTIFEKLLVHYVEDRKTYYLVEMICKMIMNDVNSLPKDVKVPAIFKRYTNKYKYVRYLNASQNVNTCKRYNLQLRETISPTYEFNITKAEIVNMVLPPLAEWFSIGCGLCKEVFVGEMIEELISHYNIHHQNEPDWLCCNCGQSFKMIDLAKQQWYHDC